MLGDNVGPCRPSFEGMNHVMRFPSAYAVVVNDATPDYCFEEREFRDRARGSRC